MKAVVATAITTAALVLGTGVARADSPTDVFAMDKFIAELKQHGQDTQDENSAIVGGLIACNGIAEKHGSRDAWVNTMPTGLIPRSTWASQADAAIDAFCPQFKH